AYNLTFSPEKLENWCLPLKTISLSTNIAKKADESTGRETIYSHITLHNIAAIHTDTHRRCAAALCH
ncbi:hypothetical protein OS493_025600, partial [Desmophyllum pertusum]